MLVSCLQANSRVALVSDDSVQYDPAAKELSKVQLSTAVDWLEYAKALIHAGFDYFEDTVTRTLKSHIKLYEVVRLCHPLRTSELSWGVGSVRQLLSESTLLEFAPFLSDYPLDKLLTELPVYLQAVKGLQERRPPFEGRDIMPFWRSNAGLLPTWSAMARAFATLTPSSAAAERVFSILKNSFGRRQTGSLEDYVSAACMLQFNRTRLRGNETPSEVEQTDVVEITVVHVDDDTE